MPYKNIYLLLLLVINKCTIYALEPRDISIIIISQDNVYNNNLAQNLENNIKEQSNILNKASPIIYISNYRTDWTILNILPRILEKENFVHWLFICSDRTHINLEKLVETLSKYMYTEKLWIGHALFDQDATIIHHFAFHENPTSFLYPNLGSGFAMTMSLAANVTKRFLNENFENEFSIDAMHELSMYIWKNDKGFKLIDDPKFCVDDLENCATHITEFNNCGENININNIYFAVKTCNNFHNTRVNIVKNTWAKYIKNINFFSDKYDKNIGTINLNVPNTDHGHCAKTFEIIKYFYNNFKNINYLVITDDDTIISPYRLTKLLKCYENEHFLALGERYGYHTIKDQNGYNYITGGGGIVLNRNLVTNIIENEEFCKCPKANSPDDMFLGVCLERLGVQIIHSNQFHQARPNDYSDDYLSRNEAISFHKHWMVDPEKIYVEWFEEDDKKLLQNFVRDEL